MTLNPRWRELEGPLPPAAPHGGLLDPLKSTRQDLVDLVERARQCMARADAGVERVDARGACLEARGEGARTAMKLFIAELQRQLTDFARHFSADIDEFMAHESAALARTRAQLVQGRESVGAKVVEMRYVLEDEGRLSRYGSNIAITACTLIDRTLEGMAGGLGGVVGGLGGGDTYDNIVFVPRIQMQMAPDDIGYVRYCDLDPGVVDVVLNTPSPSTSGLGGVVTAVVGRPEMALVHTNAPYCARALHHIAVSVYDHVGSRVAVQMEDNANGSYFALFTPLRAGEHSFHTRVFGLEVRDSPQRIMVVEPEEAPPAAAHGGGASVMAVGTPQRAVGGRGDLDYNQNNSNAVEALSMGGGAQSPEFGDVPAVKLEFPPGGGEIGGVWGEGGAASYGCGTVKREAEPETWLGAMSLDSGRGRGGEERMEEGGEGRQGVRAVEEIDRGSYRVNGGVPGDYKAPRPRQEGGGAPPRVESLMGKQAFLPCALTSSQTPSSQQAKPQGTEWPPGEAQTEWLQPPAVRLAIPPVSDAVVPPLQAKGGSERYRVGGVPGGYTETASWSHRRHNDSDRQGDKETDGQGGMERDRQGEKQGHEGGNQQDRWEGAGGSGGFKLVREGVQRAVGPSVAALRVPKGPGPSEAASQWNRNPHPAMKAAVQSVSASGQQSVVTGAAAISSSSAATISSSSSVLQQYIDLGVDVLRTEFVGQLGHNGNGPEALFMPIGVTANSVGDVIVCDTRHNLVKVFSRHGPCKHIIDGYNGKTFLRPSAAVVNRRDEIFIKDDLAVHVFDPSGAEWVRSLGQGQLEHPYGLSFTEEGQLMLFDHGGRRHPPSLLTFDPEDGRLIQRCAFEPLCGESARGGGRGGGGPGGGSKCRFMTCHGGHAYIVDLGRSVVYKVDGQGRSVATFGQYGRQLGCFNEPSGITADSRGNLLIADSRNNRIQLFTSLGEPRGYVALTQEIIRPSDIHLSPSDGLLLISNYLKHCIKLFRILPPLPPPVPQ